MLHCAVTGERITRGDFLYPNLYNGEQEFQEAYQDHYSFYKAENRLLHFIEEGNLEYRKAKEELMSIGDGMKLASGDHLRQLKDQAIIYCALCSRAAIRGGLDTETALALNDRYVQTIEAADRLGKVNSITENFLEDFVRRVHRTKAQDGISPQIKKSCDYIDMHLADSVCIHELAERMGYTDYYFSNKFKKEMGISVKEYIRKLRIDLAKEMLRNTNLDIQEISMQLGYGSQSYFGEKFRAEVGMTPGEYRAGKE